MVAYCLFCCCSIRTFGPRSAAGIAAATVAARYLPVRESHMEFNVAVEYIAWQVVTGIYMWQVFSGIRSSFFLVQTWRVGVMLGLLELLDMS